MISSKRALKLGNKGEVAVRHLLDTLGNECRTLHNVILPKEASYVPINSMRDTSQYKVVEHNGILCAVVRRYMQIDHIAITPNGVFIIETKNCNGSLIGLEKEKYWAQIIGGKYNRNKLYNPIKQNKEHAKEIIKQLGLSDNTVHDIVVFTSNGVDFSNIKSEKCIRIDNLKQFISNQEIVFGSNEINDIADRIAKLSDKDLKQQHRMYISSIETSKNNRR